MSRTRKFGNKHRRNTRNRKRKMKGGGKLDRLPIGPGARNATGNPVQIIPRGAAAGAGTAATYPLRGTSEAYTAGRAAAERRMPYLSVLSEKPENGSWTNTKYLSHVQQTIPLLKRNLQHAYITPNVYESVASRSNNIAAQFATSLSSLSEENAKKYSLPAIPSTAEVIRELETDLTNNWDFKYICGHGVLAPELSPAIVPPRTYIRFHSPAGCVAVVSGEKTGLTPIMAFPEIFAQTKRVFIKDMVDSYLKNTGPLESFSSSTERANVIANPYPPEFCSRPMDPLSESKLCLAPEYTKQTIYMPGESIPQMRISFINNPYRTLILGVYDLPMDVDFYQAVQSVSQNIMEEQPKKPEDAMNKKEFDEGTILQSETDKMLFKNDSFPIINEDEEEITIRNPNLAKHIIGRTLTLTDVLETLPAVPDGKVRFLFINSCRGVPRVLEDTGMASNILHATLAESTASGAGAIEAPPKRLLNVIQRKELATHARRLSLGAERSIADQALFQQLIEARKYMKTHPISDPERAVKAAFDAKIMAERPDLWSMAITLVPDTNMS